MKWLTMSLCALVAALSLSACGDDFGLDDVAAGVDPQSVGKWYADEHHGEDNDEWGEYVLALKSDGTFEFEGEWYFDGSSHKGTIEGTYTSEDGDIEFKVTGRSGWYEDRKMEEYVEVGETKSGHYSEGEVYAFGYDFEKK